MVKGLNIKGLCKQIREAKHSLIWSYDGETHLITNRHWLIRLSALPTDVFVELLKAYNGIQLEAGHAVSIWGGEPVLKNEPISAPSLDDTAVEMNWTDYYRNGHSLTGMMRIFKRNDLVKFVNNSYLQAIPTSFTPLTNDKPLGIVGFKEVDYLVLPVRCEPEQDILKIMEGK